MSPLDGFDFSALDRTDFGEEGVREEIIAPILRAVGYGATGRHRIGRNVRLEHPYVTIGTTTRKLALIPDYVLYVDERPVLVLDAKRPSEVVDDREHVAQVYSYAINREIRADWFALCNGRNFALFHVGDATSVPRLNVPLTNLEAQWLVLARAIDPPALSKHSELRKDFGIHLMKLGLDPTFNLSFFGVPVTNIAKCRPNLFTFSGTMRSDEGEYVASFDLDAVGVATILYYVPDAMKRQILGLLLSAEPRVHLNFEPPIAGVNILRCRLSPQIEENAEEHFVPMRIDALDPVEIESSKIARTISRGQAP